MIPTMMQNTLGTPPNPDMPEGASSFTPNPRIEALKGRREVMRRFAPRQGGGPPGTGTIALPAGDDYIADQAPGRADGVLSELELRDLEWDRFEDREAAAKERFRAGPPGIVFPQFLPYHGDLEVETTRMRRDYMRMMNDPDVSSSVESIVYGVAAQEPQFIPRDRKNYADQKCCELVRWNLTERIQEQWAQGVVWPIVANAMVQGFCANYKEWELEEQHGEFYGSWPIAALKAADVEQDIVLETDSGLNIVGLMGLRYNAGVQFSPGEWVIQRRCPYKNNPSGTSALRPAYRSWWFLHLVRGLRGLVAQKRATSVPYAEQVQPNQQVAVGKALQQLQGKSFATFPKDVIVKALELARGSEEHFASFVKDSQEEIARAIQHGTLAMMTGGAGESRGNAQEQRKGRDLVIWYHTTLVINALSNHKTGLIRDIVELNVDRERLPITGLPKLMLGGLDIDELKKHAELSKALLDNGMDLSREQEYELYAKTPPKDKGDVLPGKKQQTSNTGMGNPVDPAQGSDAPDGAAPPADAGGGDQSLDAILGGAGTATPPVAPVQPGDGPGGAAG